MSADTRPSAWSVVMVGAIGFVGALAGTLAAQLVNPAPTLAVVQIDHVLAEHVATVAQRDWSEARQQAELRRFAAALETSLADLSGDGRAVLLNGPAVVSGAPDWTPALQARMQRALASTEPAP
jgi:hypothetical protein